MRKPHKSHIEETKQNMRKPKSEEHAKKLRAVLDKAKKQKKKERSYYEKYK